MDQVSEPRGGARGWTRSDFLLSVASRILRLVAFVSLVIALISLSIFALMELYDWLPVFKTPVPPEYVSQRPTIDSGTIDASLSPPTNIRFVVLQSALERPPGPDQIIGYFTAETPLGLNAYPNDFDILGGPDAGLFERTPVRLNGGGAGAGQSAVRFALHPTQLLVDRISSGIKTNKWQTSAFALTVVARDRFGHTSQPTNVGFSISYGPPAEAPKPKMAPLEQLARDIALTLDPKRTTAYFDAYAGALAEPSRCGAVGTANFVVDYRQAFETFRERLSVANIDAFYAGVCMAWKNALAREAAERNQVDAARAAAIRHNSEMEAAHAIGAFGVRLGQGLVLAFVQGVVLIFLVTALSLAFLAMESHSRAIRDAVKTLAERLPG